MLNHLILRATYTYTSSCCQLFIIPQVYITRNANNLRHQYERHQHERHQDGDKQVLQISKCYMSPRFGHHVFRPCVMPCLVVQAPNHTTRTRTRTLCTPSAYTEPYLVWFRTRPGANDDQITSVELKLLKDLDA